MSRGTWEEMDPWEKAAQWREVAPEISQQILRLATRRARHAMLLELKSAEISRTKAETERKALEFTQRESEAARAFNESEAKKARLFAEEQERLNGIHRRKMEARLWLTQLIGVLGGLACIVGLIAVAWRYADTGNIGPGVAVFGLGTGLIGGVYGVQRLISKRVDSTANSTASSSSTDSQTVSATETN